MSENQELLNRAGSEKTADEHVVCRAALLALLSGEAVGPARLAAATSFAEEKVQALLGRLIVRGLVVVEPASGDVVGSWGLSLVPTEHRLHIRGRQLYTWCALDAVGIPAGLGEDATVDSHCHQCGVPVNIEMTLGRASHVEPPDVHIWWAAEQVGRSVVGFT
jgi:alkylmercury lyase